MPNGLKHISFQGIEGAYSHLALKDIYPNAIAVPSVSFEHALSHVTNGDVDAAFIPVENSQWGRVSDVHHLLPTSGLYITSEYFHRVRHKLLGIKGSQLKDIKKVYSHPQALGQCRNTLNHLGVTPISFEDTAAAAQYINIKKDVSLGAIASSLAADLYELDVLQENLEDADHNTTRFLLMEKKQPTLDYQKDNSIITSILFQTRNIPAALFKTLGGFATNKVNIIRLESYIKNGSFTSSEFYAEIEGYPDQISVQNALEELSFFAKEYKILGVYHADKNRNFFSNH